MKPKLPVLLMILASACFGTRFSSAAEPAVEQALERLLLAPSPVLLDSQALYFAQARKLYEARTEKPVWWTAAGWSERAHMAVRWLQAAELDGLRPLDYPAALQPLPRPDRKPDLIARSELLLSMSMLRFIADVQVGRPPPPEVDPDLRVPPRQVDAVGALSVGLAVPDFTQWLANLPPDSRDYRALRGALSRYRTLAAGTSWPRLADGVTLRIDDHGLAVVSLRHRLALLGDLAAPSASQIFDRPLEQAVRSFQRRHGLDVDGVVGPATARALNRTPSERVRQIALNLERLRWMAPSLGRRHVLVNIAAFELTAVADNESQFKTPVVVGEDYRRTPVFSDRMTNLVLSPTWTVPLRIARLDLLPKIKAEPDFLLERKFRVYSGWGAEAAELDPRSIDWASVEPEEMSYKFRQDPGPLNALGSVRFSLTNTYSIYLHDTPHRNLFRRSQRAFSSGCIRVRDAEALARFALDGLPDWPGARLREAMESGQTQVVKLARPLPVHITYLTAWVDEAGILQFREDVYGRDRLLAERF